MLLALIVLTACAFNAPQMGRINGGNIERRMMTNNREAINTNWVNGNNGATSERVITTGTPNLSYQTGFGNNQGVVRENVNYAHTNQAIPVREHTQVIEHDVAVPVIEHDIERVAVPVPVERTHNVVHDRVIQAPP
jgi:hypothetical protein